MLESVLEVSCLTCPGVIDVVNPERVRQAAIEHHQQLHPWVRTPVEGTDYVAIAAPKVCDTCLGLIELPYWEHISTPPTHAGGELDRDGRWLDIFRILASCVSELRVCVLDMSVRQGPAVASSVPAWLGLVHAGREGGDCWSGGEGQSSDGDDPGGPDVEVLR